MMTMIFYDLYQNREQSGLEANRVVGTVFDEVLYADDTICVSESETAMNWLLYAIENEGSAYGLKLNKGKCELLIAGTARPSEHIKFGLHVSKVFCLPRVTKLATKTGLMMFHK